jgi:hypothetical protein
VQRGNLNDPIRCESWTADDQRYVNVYTIVTLAPGIHGILAKVPPVVIDALKQLNVYGSR